MDNDTLVKKISNYGYTLKSQLEIAITRLAKQLSTYVSKINVFVIIMPVSKWVSTL